MRLNKLNRKYPGKRAIVTGANSGIGYEITKILLSNDWSVLAIDLLTNELDRLNEQCPLLHISDTDVTNRKQLEEVICDFCAIENGVDILFNNAGVGEGVRFKDYFLDDWDWIININLKAVIGGCYLVRPYMADAGKGLIVNMASAAGYANLPNMSPYNVTKAGVIALSESLAHEFKIEGIQVKCITPTFFRSNILKDSRGTEDVLKSAKRIVKNAKLSSLDAAQKILERLHKKEENLRFPFSARAIYHSKRFFPKTYSRVVRRFLVK